MTSSRRTWPLGNLQAVVDLFSAVQLADQLLSDLLQVVARYASPQRENAFVEFARNEVQLVVARLAQSGLGLRLNQRSLLREPSFLLSPGSNRVLPWFSDMIRLPGQFRTPNRSSALSCIDRLEILGAETETEGFRRREPPLFVGKSETAVMDLDAA